MNNAARKWLDLRVLAYGVVPAALYLTPASVLAAQTDQERQTTQQLRTGTEVVAVFFTCSSCVGNTYPNFRSTISSINIRLDSLGAANGFIPRRVGVSLDWDIQAGVKLLEEFGRFDEIAVGNNWLNSAALRYMVEDMPGRMAVPQLVLVQREVVAERGRPLIVKDEQVLLRLVGAGKIHEWHSRGMVIPGSLAEDKSQIHP